MVFQGHEPYHCSSWSTMGAGGCCVEISAGILISAGNFITEITCGILYSQRQHRSMSRFMDTAYFIWVLPLTGSSMRSMGFEPALRSMRDQRSTTTAILAGQLELQFKTNFIATIPSKRLREWLKNLPLFRGMIFELHRYYTDNILASDVCSSKV